MYMYANKHNLLINQLFEKIGELSLWGKKNARGLVYSVWEWTSLYAVYDFWNKVLKVYYTCIILLKYAQQAIFYLMWAV